MAVSLNLFASAFHVAQRPGRCAYIPFINAADPDLTVTRELILLAERCGAGAIELGVPFANSVTDGSSVLNSHSRALAGGVELEDVFVMLKGIKACLSIPVILLMEYSYTVKPRGLPAVLQGCADSGAQGVLLHCLPPLLLDKYLQEARRQGLEVILGLFPHSSEEQIEKIIRLSPGYIYLAAAYGKTGGQNGLTPATLDFFREVRGRTKLPLAVGFGIRSGEDLNLLAGCGVDAGIIGSPLCRIIEENLADIDKLLAEMKNYFKSI